MKNTMLPTIKLPIYNILLYDIDGTMNHKNNTACQGSLGLVARVKCQDPRPISSWVQNPLVWVCYLELTALDHNSQVTEGGHVNKNTIKKKCQYTDTKL